MSAQNTRSKQQLQATSADLHWAAGSPFQRPCCLHVPSSSSSSLLLYGPARRPASQQHTICFVPATRQAAWLRHNNASPLAAACSSTPMCQCSSPGAASSTAQDSLPEPHPSCSQAPAPHAMLACGPAESILRMQQPAACSEVNMPACVSTFGPRLHPVHATLQVASTSSQHSCAASSLMHQHAYVMLTCPAACPLPPGAHSGQA